VINSDHGQQPVVIYSVSYNNPSQALMNHLKGRMGKVIRVSEEALMEYGLLRRVVLRMKESRCGVTGFQAETSFSTFKKCIKKILKCL
jgi:hypothetical protein